jgi:hypothetical protein
MKLRWNGDTTLRVRINDTDDKVDIAPGATFEVPRSDHAIYIMRYHRPLITIVSDEMEESQADATGAVARVKKVVTAKQRKTKTA